MASPFPGMDPYLEDPEYWHSFHHHLAEEIMDQLNPRLVPKYYADVEVHVTMQEVGVATAHAYPDVNVVELTSQAQIASPAVAVLQAPVRRPVELPRPVKLRTVQVRLTETKALVTSIELLSPVNKNGGGLEKYRKKRQRILRSDVHLIEIDLLRDGQRPGREVATPPLDTDYVVLVNRAQDAATTRISEIWPIALNEPLPVIPVPLLEPDPDVPLDLAAVFAQIYERAYYGLRIDHAQPVPPPALRAAMAGWWAERQQTESEE